MFASGSSYSTTRFIIYYSFIVKKKKKRKLYDGQSNHLKKKTDNGMQLHLVLNLFKHDEVLHKAAETGFVEYFHYR